jgi:hypothetical protein
MSTALATLVLSLLPIAFQSLGLAEPGLWALSSALMTVLLLSLQLLALRWRRRYPEEIRAGELRLAAGVVLATSSVVFVAELLNAFGAFRGREFGIFFLGLVFLVAFGSYLFARMLFLWRG